MTLKQLIQPMQFVVIKDFVAQLLNEEVEAQKVIAAAPPYELTAEEIEQQVNFIVYKDTFSIIDAENMPAVAINIENTAYPTENQYGSVGKYKENVFLKVSCFALGVSTEADEAEGIPEYTADQNANQRLLYLVSQVINMLCAAPNWKKRAGSLIEVPVLEGWQRVETPKTENEAEVIMGIEVSFRLRTTERFEGVESVDLEELYIGLGIDGGNVDPFIQISYNS